MTLMMVLKENRELLQWEMAEEDFLGDEKNNNKNSKFID